MAWVRYDDQLNFNAKVTAALLEDPGVMSLHLMGNTWTSAQKKSPGYIPATQVGALVFDRSCGDKWADILVRNNLWHVRGQECDRCREAYSSAPTAPGFVVHDLEDYKPPARERQTAGTPAELSAKRREAGRRGGLASASKQAARANADSKTASAQANQAKSKQDPPTSEGGSEPDLSIDGDGALLPIESIVNRDEVGHSEQTDKQTARANAANGASKASNTSSNSVSPVPVPEKNVASNEATASPAGAYESRRKSEGEVSPRDISAIVGAYMDGAKNGKQPRPAEKLRARVGKEARALLAEGNSVDELKEAAHDMGHAGWLDLAVQIQRTAAAKKPRDSPHGPHRNPENQDEFDEWNAGRAPR